MGKKEAARKALWMRQCEERATALAPELTGRMDWDTANYLYNTGMDAVTAGTKLADKLIYG